MFASGDGKVRIECRFESDTLGFRRLQLLHFIK
jgi:hypothetical protein